MIHHASKPGMVGGLVAAGVGAASFYGAAKAAQNVSFLQQHWWAAPAALAAVGLLVRSKWSLSAGNGVLGAAGALGAMSYYVQSQPIAGTSTTASTSTTTQPTNSTPVTTAPAAAAGLSGGTGAGALMAGPRGAVRRIRSEAGMLVA